jgi:hypothetical protein
MAGRTVLSAGRRAAGPGATALAVMAIASPLFGLQPPLVDRPPTVDVVLARVGWYVAGFVDRFTNVVSEETYRQEVTVAAMRRRSFAGAKRDLKSDFLLVQPAPQSPWIPFRDVYEVDGSPVRGREARLARLFLDAPMTTSIERANEIAQESARYNIGAVQRTVNNPVLTLAFLQEDWQDHFTWTLGRAEPELGPTVWTLLFAETARPTVIRGPNDLPSRGRFWVDAETGRVVKAELVLDSVAVHATVTTTFGRDDRFGIDVPVSMEEHYVLADTSEILGMATYGAFRRFDVVTDEEPARPAR